MPHFTDITPENFHTIIDFLIAESQGSHRESETLKEGDLAALVTFLEEHYREDLGGRQIEDIYMHPEERKIYIETVLDLEEIPEYILSIDTRGKITREVLTPDHVLFDIYAQESEYDEDEPLED